MFIESGNIYVETENIFVEMSRFFNNYFDNISFFCS